jgi:glutathione synthase/RimK-type ligase-like ATP-grasp enzyme
MTVLLVSASYDIAADYVARVLGSGGVAQFRLNTDKFPAQVRATFDPPRGFRLSDGQEELDSRDVTAVWYRRHVRPELPEDLQEGVREFCERESRAFLGGVLETLRGARWLSPPGAIAVAEKKPYQLSVASELGFEIPATVMTNDPSAVLEFAASSSLVAKAVSSGYIRSNEGNRGIFTSRVGEVDLEDLGGLTLAPVTFQQFVDKSADIRVTVIGSAVFAAEILSQSDESSRVDWRATDDPNLRHRRHELPSAIRRRCAELVRTLGLSFGAIDLALRKDGSYVFFEINPNGEWVWIEDQLGYPISQSIADWLTGKG